MKAIKICIAISLLSVAAAATYGQPVKQPRDVVEAYQVVSEFQRLFAEDLNFEPAFEATFTKDIARRRAIALSEIELGSFLAEKLDDATLIGIYKNQMQLLFLMLPLLNPSTTEEEILFFPPEIRNIFERKRDRMRETFPVYAAQLKRDVEQLRAHLNKLAAQHASVTNRIRNLKEEVLKKLEPPEDHVVKPLTSYSRGRVLRVDEEYYQIGGFAVIREGGEMKIIGFRFFSKLF